MTAELAPGALVRVGDDSRTYRLMAIEEYHEPADPPWRRRSCPVAWVRPVGGGCEREVDPGALLPVCGHPDLEKRDDGTYCTSCQSLIYAPATPA